MSRVEEEEREKIQVVEDVEEHDQDGLDSDVGEDGEEDVEEVESSGEEEPGSAEVGTDAGASEEDEGEEGELVVAIDGEEPEEREEITPRQMRQISKNNRRLLRENEKLKKLIEQRPGETPAYQANAPVLGPKPKLEDFDYDPDAFEAALDSWSENKIAAAKYEDEQRKLQQQQQAYVDQKLAQYNKRKAELRAPDFDDAEELVELSLDEDQFKLLKNIARDPALAIYALGKNPKRLQRLSKEKMLSNFIYEIASIEGNLKTSKRKPSAPPEKRVKGRSTGTGDMDSKLERARKQAETSNGIDLTEALKIRAAQMGR